MKLWFQVIQLISQHLSTCLPPVPFMSPALFDILVVGVLCFSTVPPKAFFHLEMVMCGHFVDLRRWSIT